MEKSKLGVSVGLLGALAFLLTYFTGYTAILLFAGYVVLCEESTWLKKVCVKAIFLALCFDVLLRLFGFITDLLEWIGSVVSLFGSYLNASVIYNLISIITRPINIIEAILFLALAVMALKQKTISIPFIDKMMD